MGEFSMENNHLGEKAKEKLIENTISQEDKLNKKQKLRIERSNILLNVLLIILIFTILFGIITIKSSMGITKKQKWEYKTVTVTPATKNNRIGTGAGDFSTIEQSEEQLNELGVDGWELVSSYLEMETAFPNFGDQKYATGLHSNIRPQDVVLLFKRPVNEK